MALGALAVVVVAIFALSVVEMTPQPALGTVAVDRAPRSTAALQHDADADDGVEDLQTLAGLAHANAFEADDALVAPKRALPVPARSRAVRSPANGPPGAGPTAATQKATIDAGNGASPGVAGPNPEPPTQLARASVTPSTTPTDDGQALAIALEKCSGEKFLAGVICEQKVRLRYCEGKWGQVPQCTPRVHAD